MALLTFVFVLFATVAAGSILLLQGHADLRGLTLAIIITVSAVVIGYTARAMEEEDERT